MAIDYQSSTDKWVKCISSSGTIRAVAVSTTDISNHLGSRHKLSPAGKKALAESLIAGLILSSYCKSGEKVNLNIIRSFLVYFICNGIYLLKYYFEKSHLTSVQESSVVISVLYSGILLK